MILDVALAVMAVFIWSVGLLTKDITFGILGLYFMAEATSSLLKAGFT